MASNKKIVTLILITLVGLAFTGCSDSSDSPAGITVDTAPPAVPAELDMVFSNGSVTLTWAQNTVDSDLAGYIVVREHNGVSLDLVGTPALIHSFIDADPPVGASTYHVYAVDTSGNQSAVSSMYLTIARGHQTDELFND